MVGEKPESVGLPIEWHIPEDLESKYATNLVIQNTPNEFILSFFETRPPLLLGTKEEQATKLKEMESVRATCISRIVVAPERMNEFVKIIQESLEKFRRT